MNFRTPFFVAVFGVLASSAGFAQTPPPASQSIDDLLKRVEQGIARDQGEQRERLAAFERDASNQQALLEQSRAQLKRLETESATLEARYANNEQKLTSEETRLNERLGSLRELFGALQQTTGEFKGVVLASAVSSQYPGREEFLTQLIAKAGASSTFPSIEEIERLWFEMQREITAAGKVQKYSASIVNAAGQPVEAEVTRVGTFNVISGGSFLTTDTETGKLVELASQPHGDPLDSAARFESAAPGGHEWLWLDPSRGVLLALHGSRPGTVERLQQGGAVGYVIMAVGVMGAIAAVYQFFFLTVVGSRVRRQLAHLDKPSTDNPLGRVLATFRGDMAKVDQDPEVVELRLSEAVMKEIPPLERFQSLLKLVVAAGPLLGLVGTVIGMIITFQAIQEAGSSDPKLMASGISHAMVATGLGLGIAIPLLFMNAVLVSRSKRIVQALDEQSAGLLAERLERMNRGAAPAAA
ncbi:MAG: MotA/TolQ/ExbB proton channel family protein [Panacagrimonas sp.]